MKATSSILRHEFIGLLMKVVKSSHPDYERIEGRVIDETKNMFTVLQNGRRKMVPKKVCVFHFILPSGKVVEVDGQLITFRPEDRPKKI